MGDTKGERLISSGRSTFSLAAPNRREQRPGARPWINGHLPATFILWHDLGDMHSEAAGYAGPFKLWKSCSSHLFQQYPFTENWWIRVWNPARHETRIKKPAGSLYTQPPYGLRVSAKPSRFQLRLRPLRRLLLPGCSNNSDLPGRPDGSSWRTGRGTHADDLLRDLPLPGREGATIRRTSDRGGGRLNELRARWLNPPGWLKPIAAAVNADGVSPACAPGA